MSDVNGFRVANENVLRALARATAAARAGNVAAVAVIVVSPAGMPDVCFAGEGECLPSVNIGADMLKQYLLTQVVAACQQPTTPIVRPATGAYDG